ncbi:MAG: glycosyltransferase family 39 protein [Patescibacteria group bacterium]|nr:glycosyltransferase family 39 protein [Patescibacteria group bacterium]
MSNFNHLIPLQVNYAYNFEHRYFKNTTQTDNSKNLSKKLVVYDAHWYFKLATDGYIKPDKEDFINPKREPNILQFAFFPMYPFVLSFFHKIFQPITTSIETSAFILSIFLQILLVISLYIVIKKFTNKTIAFFSSLLLFFFPSSIFFRSYYTETLFLLLLLWFSFFTYTKHFFLAAIMLGFLTITRGTAMLFLLLFAIYLFLELRRRNIGFLKFIFFLVVTIIPLSFWMYLCYIKIGNPIMFISVREYWVGTKFPLWNIIQSFSMYPFLPLHSFHASKIDSFLIVAVGFILYKSRFYLPRLLWWVSFCLWITPLITHDTMSFSRYQTVNFPLFIYLASLMKTRMFIIAWSLSFIALIIVSILFLNYYWIG